MSELRQDRTTGGWVIIAPQRGRRPQMREPGGQLQQRPRFDPACPFCPGNEMQLADIIAETPARGQPGWSVRVVSNKFPAVQMQHGTQMPGCDHHQVRAGRGVHEVIIESPRHDAELATMPVAELTAAVAAYRQRSRTLLDQDGVETVILYRNHGRHAGASLMHPHAQVIALDFVPPRLAALIDWSARYFRDHGGCPICDEVNIECKSGKRVVEVSDRFVTLVPFAAEHPFELWLVPKRHQASFSALDDDELADFAGLLGRSLQRLDAALDSPAYNFVIDSAPKHEAGAPHLHWRLRIVPDTAIWGGFELGASLPINPSRPEDDALALRAVWVNV